MKEQPFVQQRKALFDENLHWNGAWERVLPQYGYEVDGILCNVQPLQRAWCAENNIEWPGIRWREIVALEQLRAARPEVLFLDGGRFSGSWLRAVRSHCPDLRVVLVLAGSPSFDVELLRESDVVLSCSRNLSDFFVKEGCSSQHFPHAFNDAIASVLPSREPVQGVVFFAGGLIRGNDYHLLREELIEHLVTEVPVRIHSERVHVSLVPDAANTLARRAIFLAQKVLGASGFNLEQRRRMPLIGRAANWKSLPMFQYNAGIRKHLQEPLFGKAMFSAMRQCAVALNMHIGIAGGYASNIRLFEATGVGACLLTDRSVDLGDYFELDREVVSFRDKYECAEKARWLLDHPREREEIARRGQARTMRDHTYRARAGKLHATISEFLHRG